MNLKSDKKSVKDERKEKPVSNYSSLGSLLVACDKEWGIGKNGTMPWHFKEDLRWFKRFTTSGEKENIVVMGYNTWLSLPKKPLPLRRNCVLTTKHLEHVEKSQAISCDSIKTFLKYCEEHREKIGKIFIIGGAQIYNLFLKNHLVEKIYITHIEKIFDCDTFFPIDQERLEKVKEHHTYKENDTTIKIVEYRLIK